MTNIVFLSFLSFFAVFGICSILNEVINSFYKSSPSFVLLTVKNRENDIEYSIRSLLHKYPTSEIIITDKNSSDATLEIARRMAMMYERIHIR
jgi:cellulose synthase/poly-beta-1,6-N-acetylglucosamine synthase-like glycosyltransferase